MAQPYVNPKAPVHVVTGSAGCRERIDNFNPNPPAWSAFRHSDYGYTHMEIFNSTHLHLQQVSDDQVIVVFDFSLEHIGKLGGFHAILLKAN